MELELGARPPFNWTNSHGGPLVRGGDPTSWFAHHHAPPRAVDAFAPSFADTFAPSSATPHYNYSYVATRLIAGDDLAILTVSSALRAQLACSAHVLCRGVTYNSSGVNGTIPRPTTAYLKSAAAFLCNSREQSGCGAPWSQSVGPRRPGGRSSGPSPSGHRHSGQAHDDAAWTHAGVDKLTFTMRMLIAMGVQLCGQPLDYARDVAPLIARFDTLDADGNGHLTTADLSFMVKEAQKYHPQLAEQAKAKRRLSALPQSLGPVVESRSGEVRV